MLANKYHNVYNKVHMYYSGQCMFNYTYLHVLTFEGNHSLINAVLSVRVVQL